MMIFPCVILSIILVSFVSASTRKILLFDDTKYKGPNITISYSDDECVNVPNDWKWRISSAITYGECLTFYDKTDCIGNQLSWSYYDMWMADFNDKTLSFQRCDSNREKKPGFRAEYQLWVYDEPERKGDREERWYKTSECINLSERWRQRISSIYSESCVVFYKQLNCKGKMKYFSYDSAGHTNLQDVGFNNMANSISSCDLYFKPSCSNCPKMIYKGSNEWKFWTYWLSLYSPKYSGAFEKQVTASPNGSIPWDFLFEPNTAAKLPGGQYQDVITMVRRGAFGLSINTSSADRLFELAYHVWKERRDQLKKISPTRKWQDHTYVVIWQMLQMWEKIFQMLHEYEKVNDYPEKKIECGLRWDDGHNTDSLINDGEIANFGDDPWHVAIYKKTNSKSTLICGATLISEEVAVSAAHCFYSTSLKAAMNDTSQYEIYVAKYTRNYNKIDNKYQKIHKIQSLIFSPRGYNLIADHYGSDIILIILETPVKMNGPVAPVCLDWEDATVGFSPPPGTMGRVVGWGTNRDGVLSEILLAADLPYISYENCVGKVNHVTPDKFCGGMQTGPGAQKGDSGGAFVFKKDGRYYLRGVVSTKDKNSNSSISTFTDISQYLNWIFDYI